MFAVELRGCGLVLCCLLLAACAGPAGDDDPQDTGQEDTDVEDTGQQDTGHEDPTYTVGGTLAGLVGSGLVLQNNAGDDLAIAVDGSFVFPTALDDGSPYEVTVHAQPADPSQTCEVSGGEGTLDGADVTSVLVNCVTDTFAVGGTVSGLSGSGLLLRLNGEDDLPIAEDGPFAFATALEDGAAYEVTVQAQPTGPAQLCEVAHGAGTLDGADVTEVEVTCEDLVEILEFSSSRSLVSPGEPFDLLWATHGASGCEISPGALPVTPEASGSLTLTLDESTVFTLSCEGLEGPVAREVEVLVTDADWAQVSTGDVHTCAVKDDGRLFCWGWGLGGQLGNGGTSSLVPVQETTGADDWAQVSVGGEHTCAVKDDGRLFCWGLGVWGQLGDGTAFSNSLEPVQEATESEDWAQVSAGRNHTCAVTDDGHLFCWGFGASGQLGLDDRDFRTVPEQVTEGDGWEQVSAGAEHTCAVKRDGRLFCWGSGLVGKLGHDDTEDSLVPVQEATEAGDWAQVSAGTSHTCAVTTEGALFCWGSNTFGELGDDTIPFVSLVPTQEATAASDWAQVTAGESFSCAVKDDGRLFCWGRGDDGRLGHDATSDALVPVQEATGSEGWAQVVSGIRTACAVKDDGRLYCWGHGADGQLGRGTTGEHLWPVQEASGAQDWWQATAGAHHGCAVTEGGQLWCWGDGFSGQLGQGLFTDSAVPVQEATEAEDWRQVSAGERHTCAVKLDGRLFCWGDGEDGRLGHDATSESAQPVQEATGAEDWWQVSAGERHTCAVTVDGRLFCWGDGEDGRLGQGDTEGSLAPVQVGTEADDWAQVSAGAAHTCAIQGDGRLFCWGAGEGGRLGHGSAADSLLPVQEVTEGTDWAQVSAGQAHTCAVKASGALLCWGEGGAGQLGSEATSSLLPLQEATGSLWWRVSAGGEHSCAVKADGRLSCWGDGSAGQLGDGDTSGSPVPVQEATATANWWQPAAGEAHTCALKTDGRLFCWGADATGQLGIGKLPRLVWPTE